MSPSTSKDKRLKKETQVRDEVQQGETSLGKRLGASVTLLGFSDANGLGFRPVVRHDASIAQGDAYDDATEVFRTGKGRFSFGTIDGVDNARAALPIKKGFVLVVRRLERRLVA